MKVIRVFPRQTCATPVDELVAINRPPDWFDEADEVHVSCSWTWDIPVAERLAKEWAAVASVSVGGPAYGDRSDGFEPGMYVKKGYTITSRGCPNRCWFCSVWRREGELRELKVKDGWNVLDDNLLACSDRHIMEVFDMLARQPEKPQFTGGLEAKRLLLWHADEMRRIKTKQAFFAYDTPDDYDPLVEAGKTMIAAGFTLASHALRCYVLCGYPGDTTEKAEGRMRQTIDAGFTPMAMALRNETGDLTEDWHRFQREWARPAIIHRSTVEKGK